MLQLEIPWFNRLCKPSRLVGWFAYWCFLQLCISSRDARKL